MVTAMRDREACALDIGGNHLRLDNSVYPKALAHEALATVHMVGRQSCITRSRGHSDGLVLNPCNIGTVAVVAAYAAHIADIGTQQRQHKMHPIMGGDPAFTDMFASADLLTNES